MIKIIENLIIVETATISVAEKNDFMSAFIRLINEEKKEILLDLLKTDFLPSELIGFLINKKKMLERKGVTVKITAINDNLKKIFDKINLSAFLGLQDA